MTPSTSMECGLFALIASEKKVTTMTNWHRWKCPFCQAEGAAKSESEAEMLAKMHATRKHPEKVKVSK